MAWPGVALAQLFARTRDRRYLDAAVRIGTWITTNTWSTQPLGGFSFGVNGSNVPVPNGSTEHNIDCVAFFGMLRELTRDRTWSKAADHARAFVDRMWDPAAGAFWTGTNDGVEINRFPVPLDTATWSWLALREKRYARALDWAGSALAVTDDASAATSQLPDGERLSGVTFSTASLTSTAQYNGITVHPQGVWLEGTNQLATALLDRNGRGDKRSADALLGQARHAQDVLGVGQHLGGVEVDGGIVAASSLIDSGFGFGYFQVQHVGATSWFVFGGHPHEPVPPPRQELSRRPAETQAGLRVRPAQGAQGDVHGHRGTADRWSAADRLREQLLEGEMRPERRCRETDRGVQPTATLTQASGPVS